MTFHVPVLLNEVIEYLAPKKGQTIVDGTLGGGGHASRIAGHIEPGILVGMDLDPQAIKEAEPKIKAAAPKTKRFLVHANYKDIDIVLDQLGITEADGMVIDLGLSSYDLDLSGRGFSFQKDEPLDMRFNPEERLHHNQDPFTAKKILERYTEKELEEIFSEYGEEKFSRRISRAITRIRADQPLLTTTDLFNLIKRSLPASLRFKAGDSARRIFQALRIEVNNELGNLEAFLPKAFKHLKKNGRLVVISFHSLEDRIVKRYFNDLAKGCICPPEFPECVCGRTAQVEILTKKTVTAGAEEIKSNPRSNPAKLRAIKKI